MAPGKMQSVVNILFHRPLETLKPKRRCSETTEVTQLEQCVAFAPDVSVRRTIHRNDYTPDEKEASWYTKEEYQNILRRCNKQIKMLDRGETFREQKYCARGLEHQTKLVAMTRHRNKRFLREVVLSAQEHFGSWDDELIAQASREATYSCQLWAQLIANRDHQAVEEYLEDVSSQWISRSSQIVEDTTTSTGTQEEQRTPLELMLEQKGILLA